MKKFLILTFVVVCLSSCNDFLSTTPYASVADKDAITDYNSATYALTGAYDAFQNYKYYGRDFMVYGDVFTENVILSATNSNRFVAEAQWAVTATTADMQYIWSQAYVAINAANKILEGSATLNATDEQKAQIKGEAIALRALAHFDIVRIFAQTYKGNENSLGIPYMSKSVVYDQPARNTVKEVYDKIIQDLKDAIPLLTQGSALVSAPYHISAVGAKALLARVYMTQLDYANAKPILQDIISTGGYSLLTNANYAAAWGKAYNSASKTEFIFSIANRADDYGATNCLGYIYMQAGYGDLRASSNLTSLYSSTDVRKAAFFTAGTGSLSSWTFVNKYPGRDGTTGLSDCSVIRLSDVYLMYAEACANTNDEPIAITYLDKVRQRADPTVAVTSATGAALLDAIALERRKEFAFEGQYFFDLKRLAKTVNSAYRSDGVRYTSITSPSTKFALPIPQAELDANVNMVQNP